MSIQTQIKLIFSGKAFLRPLFYQYPGGLRFQLAQGSSSLEQFLSAHQTASKICAEWAREGEIVTCIRWHAKASLFAHRSDLRALKAAGIRIPDQQELWSEAMPTEDDLEPDQAEYWLHLAFRISTSDITNLLWCALARDFAHIQPSPQVTIYLINLTTGLLALPYDDRGMDVVGPNHDALLNLYIQFQDHLLAYDQPTMRKTFEHPTI